MGGEGSSETALLTEHPELAEAWKVLDDAEVDETVKHSVDELKRVADNIDEIKSAPGGYRNWKNYDLEYNFREIEILDVTNNPIGEFDGIDMYRKAFIEDKSASGIKTLNPNTGKPFQSPSQWAEKQIYSKTSVRIENLSHNAVATRATGSGNAAPTLTDLKRFRTLHFRIDNVDPSVVQAVEQQLVNLKTKYPFWEFTAQYGLN